MSLLICYRFGLSQHWRILIQIEYLTFQMIFLLFGALRLLYIGIWIICIIILIWMQPINKVSVLSQEQPDARAVLEQENKYDGMSKLHIWAYGVGHFVNDLAAACWFNYLFYFLKKIVQTDAATSALLAGQICDGIATPIVGIFSDKTKTKIGQRKPWYIGGLILVISCFIPLFTGFKSENSSSEYAFYIIFPGLFNIGWASLQISHMSLVPSLTCSRKRRDRLNNLRNSFTFISNFTVLGIGLIIFSSMHDKFLQYQIIAYLVMAIGLAASIFFIIKIDQPHLVKTCSEKQENLKQLLAEQKFLDGRVVSNLSEISVGESQQNDVVKATQKRQSKLDWFKMPKFYLFGVCYMCVRLYTNIFGTLLPFYLIDVLHMGTDDKDKVSFNLALVPMITYASSVVVSSQLNSFYDRFGRKKALFVGTAICIVCLVVMALLDQSNNWIMYILALFIGASQSLVLSTGINLISDVVGAKAKTGAFVFGIYSLMDKFSSGIAIFFIGNSAAYSVDSSAISDDQVSFIRLTMVLVPGISCLLSSLIVLSYPIEEYKKKGSQSESLLQKSQVEEQLVA